MFVVYFLEPMRELKPDLLLGGILQRAQLRDRASKLSLTCRDACEGVSEARLRRCYVHFRLRKARFGPGDILFGAAQAEGQVARNTRANGRQHDDRGSEISRPEIGPAGLNHDAVAPLRLLVDNLESATRGDLLYRMVERLAFSLNGERRSLGSPTVASVGVAPEGFDIDALIAFKQAGNSVVDYPEGEAVGRDAIVEVSCGIWLPAACPDVLPADNVELLDAQIAVQGANIPATPEAERALAERGVLVIPDFVANAGGVICAAVEYHGGGQDEAFATIETKIRTNVREVLETVKRTGGLPRAVAEGIAMERVKEAMSGR